MRAKKPASTPSKPRKYDNRRAGHIGYPPAWMVKPPPPPAPPPPTRVVP